MSEGPVGTERRLVLLLGWLGATPRMLRIFKRHYEARGDKVLVCTVDAFRALGTRNGWHIAIDPFAERVQKAAQGSPRPWTVHAFSNAGFWSLAALVLALQKRDPELLSRLSAIVLDCAPGFPPAPSARFTAEYGTRAALANLGPRLPPRAEPLARSMLFAFFVLWHRFARESVDFIANSQKVVRSAAKGGRVLLLRADPDPLIPGGVVRAFEETCRSEGLVVESHVFEGTGHVANAFRQPRHYFTILDRFLDAT